MSFFFAINLYLTEVAVIFNYLEDPFFKLHMLPLALFISYRSSLQLSSLYSVFSEYSSILHIIKYLKNKSSLDFIKCKHTQTTFTPSYDFSVYIHLIQLQNRIQIFFLSFSLEWRIFNTFQTKFTAKDPDREPNSLPLLPIFLL